MVDLVLNGETGTLEAYLDGKLFGSQGGLGDLFDHTGRIGIGGMDNASYFENGGADSGNSGWYFAGVIDDVSVYNLALSLDEIALHYSYSGVPEPATLVLLGMGFAALARRRRRG